MSGSTYYEVQINVGRNAWQEYTGIGNENSTYENSTCSKQSTWIYLKQTHDARIRPANTGEQMNQ